MKKTLITAATLLACSVTTFVPLNSQENEMSFFITSVGSGDGANLGGLAGADAHCKSLASAVGSGNKTWRAYLSAHSTASEGSVNARERIGFGPWFNSRGIKVADNLNNLHSNFMDLGQEKSLNEKGNPVKGRVKANPSDANEHDILTGSTLDGRIIEDGNNHTCNNWTSNGAGTAQVGHFDRQGGGANPNSWNSAHGSRSCSQADLKATGGNGYFYCFATD